MTTMTDAVTPRVAGLIQMALSMVTQAQYEGNHARRGHPEPSVGSPWDTPDAPREVLAALREAERLLCDALDHFDGDPVAAMRERVKAYL